MNTKNVFVFLVSFLFLSATNVFAGGTEKEISFDDLEDKSIDLQNLNPLPTPGKSYDDRANRLIITGYAAVSFRSNDNGVDNASGNELLFGQDPAETSDFTLNVMEIGFTKRYSRFLWFSGSFEIANRVENGAKVTETEISTGVVHLVAPVGNGLDFAFGKFNSPVSFEPEDAPLLLQASKSLPFQLASPAKMTGLKLLYPFAENLETQFIVFNGWNLDKDNNDAKSLAFQIGYAPTQWLDTKWSYLRGAELSNNESDLRQVIDLVVTLTPFRNWIFGAELAYGFDENQSALHPGTDAEWSSGQVTAHHDFRRWLGGTVRYSFFDDRDGRPDLQSKQKRTMHEVTVASTIHLSPETVGFLGFGTIPKTQHLLSGIDLRLEYRYDWINESNNNRFFKNDKGAGTSTRNMFVVELVANF